MVDGLETFTRRFRGEVWLEVLLLDGVTANLAQVEKIAAFVHRIGPARVQLSTVSRPPAEPFAQPVPVNRLLALASLFPGRVDVLTAKPETIEGAGSAVDPSEPDILALLARRPCTAFDVAAGLGLHITEALKHLDRLSAAGMVRTTTEGDKTFYIVAVRSPGSVPARRHHNGDSGLLGGS
jgi:hypothetical protein